MILNLTQHHRTLEQQYAGVMDLPDADRTELSRLLTFDVLPDVETLTRRASDIVNLAAPYHPEKVMIGGAPFFMSYLETAFRSASIVVVYAFSQRSSVEETVDGKVVKKSIFHHAGFVSANIKE